MKIDYSDYPALFRAADSASGAAQQGYLRLTKATLILLVTGAGLAAVSGEFPAAKSGFAVASAVVLAASLLLSVYLQSLNLEQVWYGGRAVAETGRSMMWRYVTGADPFPMDLAPAEAERKFLADLGSMARERKQLAFGFGGEFAGEPQITERMRQARTASLEERKDTYLSERIQDQRLWYGKRAKSHLSAGNRYFTVIALSQLLALASAIALVHWPDAKIQLTGVFASLASALMAWIQVKRHKELVQAYSVAELELSFVQEQAEQIVSDRDLSDFVADAEKAISREHTLWIAKRDRI
jgi:conflict system pore-forming effector with SLATT domain